MAREARVGAARAARLLARLVTFLFAILLDGPLVAALVVIACAARLEQGPVEVPWARPIIEAVARSAGHPLTVGHVLIAWTGLRDGPSAPVGLTLRDLRLLGANAPATIRGGTGTIDIADLLRGDLVPITLTVDGPHFRVGRSAGGRVEIAGSIIPLVPTKRASDENGTPMLPRELKTLHVHDLVIDGSDAETGFGARVSGNVDVERDAAGLLHGRVHADLASGGKTAILDAMADAASDGSTTTLHAALSPIDPAKFADLLPSLAPLSAFDAPLTLAATGVLGKSLSFERAHLDARAGAGVLRVGLGTAPIVSATLGLDLDPNSVETSTLELVTAPRPDGPRTTFSGHARAARTGSGFVANAAIDVDRAAFADLAAIWPEGTGGPGTRPWITENITAGTADHGHVEVDLTAPADLSDVALTRIDGGLDAHDLTVWWLRPVAPLVGGSVHLSIHQADEIDLAIGRARIEGTAIALDGATIRLTGIAGDDQFAAIDTPIRGPVADVIRTLKHPRLALLDKTNLPLGDTSGRLDGRILVAHLPLRDDVSFDDLGIVTDLKLRDLRIGKLLAGRDLDHGQLDLHATSDGLTIAGTAALAHIPATAKVAMDFRAGPPSGVVASGHVEARLDPGRLRSLGVDVGTALTGSFALSADARSRRDGRATIEARADLTGAGLAAGPLPWRKPVGAPVTASAAIELDDAGLRSIEHVRAEGSGVDIDGSADISGGRPSVLRLRRLRLGSAIDLAGTVALPTAPGTGYVVDVAGPTLDLTGLRQAFSGSSGGRSDRATPIAATVRIGRVSLGDGRALLDLSGHIDRGFGGLQVVELAGRTAGPPPAPFRVVMRPTPRGRLIAAQAADLGGVLAGLGLTTAIGGGRLDIVGVPELDAAGRPSTVGTATLDGFRVRDAPFVARLLKALTLYGIVDLLRGPGVGVTRLTIPFRLTGDVLTTNAARAVSPSLGVTAQGQVDLGRGLLAIRGTVVPAWILNTLPGRLPLVGQIFSPEKGGGVVAALFSLDGGLANPTIKVNPLSLLTPGALRGVFGGFDTPRLPGTAARP